MSLFQGTLLRYELERRHDRAIREVREADDDYLLNVSENEWLDYLLDQFGMDVPVFRLGDARSQAIGELRRTPQGMIARAEMILPFDGRPDLFQFGPNLYDGRTPEGEVTEGALVRHVEFAPSNPPDLDPRTWHRQLLSRYNAAVTEVETHNRSLANELRDLIAKEKTRILEARAALEALSIPVVERPDAPRTYAVPGIQRRSAPPLPEPSAPKPYEPEVLDDFYEHTIAVIRSTGKAMERTPGTFAEGSETQKRDVLLVMLNSHYQGAAAGEVFNGAGKADILLRFADHNVLVAECKFWDSIASFRDALEQLEGYLTLRDARAALIFFVTGRDVAGPVAEAEKYIATLAGAETLDVNNEETDFRYRLASTKFEDRAMTLHVLFFHVRLDPYGDPARMIRGNGQK